MFRLHRGNQLGRSIDTFEPVFNSESRAGNWYIEPGVNVEKLCRRDPIRAAMKLKKEYFADSYDREEWMAPWTSTVHGGRHIKKWKMLLEWEFPTNGGGWNQRWWIVIGSEKTQVKQWAYERWCLAMEKYLKDDN